MKNPIWRLSAALGLLVLTPTLLAQDAPPPVPAPAAAAPETPTTAALLKAMSDDERMYFQHVTTLSNPFFEGRAPGTRGNALAAEYVEFYLKKLGLQPGFPLITKDEKDVEVKTPWQNFRQSFSTGREVNARTQVFSFTADANPAEAVAFAPGKDFYARGTSSSAAVTGKVVFVGYAADNAEKDYKAFAETDDLTGKIAIMLRFEPLDEAGKSKWGDKDGFSGKANLTAKFLAVAERHAAAVILVSPPNVDDPRGKTIEDTRATRTGATVAMPLLNATVESVDKLCRAAGTSLAELSKEADAKGIVRDLPGVTATVEVKITRDPILTDNVSAVLPGKGALKDEFIVIGAHYDHVGYGYFGSRGGNKDVGKLHPGADDNASGTAGMLLLAQRFAERYKNLPDSTDSRSVLFVAFSGEEGGLIGSAYMIKHMPIEAKSVFAMLNMDMIGRLRNDKVEISGIDTADGFAEYLKPFFDSSGLDVKTLPGGNGPSDHASFYKGNVPVLHFFTLLHNEYHLPGDQYHLINAPGAVRVASLVEEIGVKLAQRKEPLVFHRSKGAGADLAIAPEETPESRAAAAATRAEKAATAVKPPAAAKTADPDDEPPATPLPRAGGKVRFGIAPANYDGENGVEVGDVYEGTSAAEAGIKAGDVIIKWNDTPVSTVQDWMKPLSQAKPGDEVAITVKRGKETLQLHAKLKAAGAPNN